MGEGERIRVVVVQPSLPRYRVPVFRELASRAGIALTVVHSKEKHLASESAEGFTSVVREAGEKLLLGQRFVWSGASLEFADPAKCDVLVLPWHTRDMALVPAMRKARKRGLGVVLWGHGYSKREGRVRKWLRDRVTKRAHSVMFYNRIAAEAFREATGRGEDVFVALNALDQTPISTQRERWANDTEGLAAFRAAHGLSERTVLFVSRLFEENRLELLLEAMKVVGERVDDAKLAVVGDGPDSERVRGLVDSMGLGDRVVMPGAVYGEEDVSAWFCASRVFCYPVNIGLSILHAFGYGLPVVTSDATEAQNPEIEALRPGENGAVYSDGDVGALAEVLTELLTDDAKWESLSRGALRTVEEDFSLSNMVDGFEGAVRWAWEQRRGG